jgi:putative ABC transport system permease protein
VHARHSIAEGPDEAGGAVSPPRWDRGPNPAVRRAPLLLLRYPGSLAALAVASLLLALALAAYPLFLSASASTLVDGEIAEPLVSRYGAGVSYRNGALPLAEAAPPGTGPPVPLHQRRGEVFSRLTSADPRLGPPVATVMGARVAVSPADRPQEFRSGILFAGTDAAGHVRIVRGSAGSGALLPDLIADALGIEPGDQVVLEGARGTVRLPVDGVYEALYSRPRTGYWLRWASQIYPACQDCAPPPQFVIMDRARVLELSATFGAETAVFLWQAPVAATTSLSLDDARDLRAFVEELRMAMARPDTSTGRIMACCSGLPSGSGITLTSSLGRVIRQVEERIRAVEAPGRLLRAAAVAVGVTVVAGAALFGLVSRRTEWRLRFAHGTGPLAGGALGALESVLPTVVGASVGLGAAWALVRLFGPDAPLASTSVATAVSGGALAAGLSIAVVALVSGAALLGHVGQHRSRLAVLARAPWEVPLLGLALYAAGKLGTGGSLVPEDAGARPSLFLLLFPVALIGGVGLLGARLFREGSRSLRERSGRLAPPAYLAVQRLAGAPDLSVLLVAASALCIGVFVQAQTVVRSLDRSVEAKARTFVGSEVMTWVAEDTEVPSDARIPMTKVTRRTRVGALLPSERSFDLLVVDASTLAGAAYWNDGFSGREIEELAAALRRRSPTGLPVVVAGPDPPGIGAIEVGTTRLPVHVVAATEAFPGMISERPLIVADGGALADATGGSQAVLSGSNATTELWIRAGRAEALAELSRLDVPVFHVISAQEVEDIPYIATVIDTFLVLNALGLGTLVLVLAALLVYLQARQRSQIVSYGLSLRMGLDRRGHRRSLLLELGSMLAAAAVLGGGLAVAASSLIVPRLDPLGAIPPEPTVDLPVVRLLVLAAALAAVALGGAWLAGRRARVAHLGEVMRVAE